MKLSDKSKNLLGAIVDTLLSHNPDEKGSPIHHRNNSDGFGSFVCGLCGVTWHKQSEVNLQDQHEDHMDYCPVIMVDKLDRLLDDEYEEKASAEPG